MIAPPYRICGHALILCCSFVIVACQGDSPSISEEEPSGYGQNRKEVVIDTRDSLEAFLVKGLLASELIHVLGSPDSAHQFNGSGPGPDLDKEIIVWVYESYHDDLIESRLVIEICSGEGTFSSGDYLWHWYYSPDL